MQLEITHQQAEVLKRLIEREVSEIGPEIHHTRTYSLRDELREQRTELQALHEQLVTATAV